MPFELKWDPKNAEVELGAVVIAYHEALTAAIEALAEVKGTDDLTWFDELHQNSIAAAKGTTTEEISIEVDASAVRLGFQTLDADFKSIRIGLIKNKK
jgi:hypothetical protein